MLHTLTAQILRNLKFVLMTEIVHGDGMEYANSDMLKALSRKVMTTSRAGGLR